MRAAHNAGGHRPWDLEILASARVIDLTQVLSEETTVLELPAQWKQITHFTRQELSAFDSRGPSSYKNAFTVGEHVGTHLDAPCHWETARDGEAVAEIPATRLIAPVAVVDKRAEVANEPDYLLTVDDIRDFEERHGPLRDGSWLLLHTGWAERAGDEELFINKDATGMHTPGPDVACARWMAGDPRVIGFGSECVSTDAGQSFRFDPPQPVHHFMLGAGKYGLASLINLSELPPVGAILIVAPLKIARGSGSPARVFALVPR